MQTIFTHADTFHADELLAIAFLQMTILKDTPNRVIRTRDPALLAPAVADFSVFVIDVGRAYAPDRLNFDHHQESFADTWPDGTPLSSCGLVWRWLRAQGAFNAWGSQALLDWLETELVRPADEHDNGVKAWSPALFLGDYNRSSRSEEDAQAAFQQALRVTHELIANARARAQKDIESRDRMARALAEPIHAEGLVVIEDGKASGFPYWAAKLGGPDIRLVVTPYKDQGWCLQATPSDLNDPFSASVQAPETWRGCANLDVETANGTVPLIFCHKGGHLTLVRGSLNQALDVAQQILAGSLITSARVAERD